VLSSFFDYAIYYSKLGFSVLPLHSAIKQNEKMVCSCGRFDCPSPAKHPVAALVPNGLKNASCDPKVIEGWFKNSSVNLGIVTGKVSGVVALDIDPRHEGDISLAALERTHGPIANTWRFLTGGQGEHLLFRHPGGVVQNRAQSIGRGIDVRGDGGYIVAPPSIHITGRRYAISVDHHPDDTPLADVPPWLMDPLPQPREIALGAITARDWRAVTGNEIGEGTRNDTITRVAGHLIGKGVDRHLSLELLLSFNATHCVPPLAEDEVLGIVISIARREMTKRIAQNERLRHV